ncbi:MAG TPA: helix-turn-helix domain-containing protein [Actinomycetota bacterium]|nr:helix-turn-helix domain-containing protein [Actinomycetota bacterium]
MARPDCPRCGSDLTVAAPSDAPSELVMELRGENVPIAEPGVRRWLCRSCGLRWDPAAYADLRLWDADDRPGPDDAPSEAGSASDGGPHEGPGTALRRARHAAGRTIADVSRATGVWERHLMALEDDAPLEEFPARSYARLYLREYAQHLGLDPESLLDALDAVHPAPEEQVLEPLPDRRGRRKVLAVVLVALSVVALALIVLNRPESPAGLQSHVPPPADRAPVAAGSNPDEPAAPAPPAREPRGIRVEVKVTQRSWVQAISDGEVVAAASFEPGKTATYRAKKALELTLGNAGGVRVRVDGERVATGGPGDVVTLDFRWRDGALSMARA